MAVLVSIELSALLDEIIYSEDIRTVFQPIVSLENGNVLGYEALSRGPEGTELERPDKLFEAAEKYNRVWEIEYLCRKKAVENAALNNIGGLLFINVDPKVMYNEKFRRGFTKDIISKYNMDPEKIIFEITEKTCIEDYKAFKSVIDNYTGQGYKIAIDDTGAGYSGLRMIAETSPQFIKLDMELIRDIDTKEINKALVKALKEFCVSCNMDIIAEGIETYEELKALIELGVRYGQGFLIQKPSAALTALRHEVLDFIVEYNHEIRTNNYFSTAEVPIGKLIENKISINTSMVNREVDKIFREDTAILGIPVVNKGEIKGLVMRNVFYSALSTTYGNAIFMNRPVELLMEKNPMVVDYSTPVSYVSNLAVKRKSENIYDCIIISEGNKYHGLITIKELLEYITDKNVEMARNSNPLTGLPGNMLIEDKLNKVIKAPGNKHVLYFDLDNFKAFNDIYGFENGDKVLKMTGELLEQTIGRLGKEKSFLGHIGGDDFIAIVEIEDPLPILEDIIKLFDARVKSYYSEKDANRGYFISYDRKGEIDMFPLTTMSISVVPMAKKNFTDSEELSRHMSYLKRKCKQCIGSCYYIDNDNEV